MALLSYGILFVGKRLFHSMVGFCFYNMRFVDYRFYCKEKSVGKILARINGLDVYIDGRRWRNCIDRHGDTYGFKWCPFSLQDTAFRILKDDLSHRKRMPLANLSEASENCKQKQPKYDMSQVPAAKLQK